MPEEFAINRYTDADRAEVLGLVGAAVSDGYAQHLDRIWDWKYDSHPLNREMEQERKENRPKLLADLESTGLAPVVANWGIDTGDLPPDRDGAPYILLLKAGNRIAAMMGCLPQAFLIKGRRFLVSAGCDMAVHPDYRGKSLSMRVSTRMALDLGLTLGWSNETSRRVGERFARRTMRQWRSKTTAGWGRMRVVALVKPIDWNYIVHRSTNLNLPGNIAAMVAAGAQRFNHPFGTPEPSGPIEIFRLEFFDERIDALWRRVSREHLVIAVRDSAYLNWRFNARPDASYVAIAASDGEGKIVGYLVYRIIEQDGARWGYIVDFLAEGDPSHTFALLVRRAEEMMVRAGVKAIVCFIAKAPFRQVLRRAGFYPSVFGTRSYVGGAIIKEDLSLRPFAEVQKWFITMADGDAEMVF
jgi:GNAT superfamily N-acetyltransferase